MPAKSLKDNYPLTKPHTSRWAIGFWATAWWGLTCLFLLEIVAYSLKPYATLSTSGVHDGLLNNGFHAARQAFSSSTTLKLSFWILLTGWIIGGVIWLKQLSKEQLSYKAAFKDLLLTIRK